MSNYDYSKNKKCELCGKSIANCAILCKTCSNKSRKGKIFSESQRENMRIAQEKNREEPNYTPPFEGKKHSLETREKMSLSQLEEGGHNWKGEDVGYGGVHQWVRKHKPKPMLCEECHKNEPFDLANISGEYKRDVNDYRWLCRRCHLKSDGRLYNRDEKGRFKTNVVARSRD